MRAGFVALLGRPNAGKSTLLNRLVGAKLAIVSDKPQTTRARILGIRNEPDAQIVFVDTPGIHRPLHRMNVRMVGAALETIGQADLVALVVDATERQGRGDRFVLERLDGARVPVVLALNKIDLIRKTRLLPLIDWYRQQREFAEIVPVSALTGDGLDALVRAMVSCLPEGEPMFPPDYLTDQPERVMAAEIVREQLLVHTHAELPYTTAVVVDRFEPAEAGGTMRLYCSILVEEESQKPIVLGRRGEMIKRIGTAARRELEDFFEARIHLDLHVKVRPAWRDSERLLDELGVAQHRGGSRRRGRRARPS